MNSNASSMLTSKAACATAFTTLSLGGVLAFWVDFVPIPEIIVAGAFISGAPAGVIFRELWRRDSKAEERLLFHGAALLFIYALCFLNLSVLAPALPAMAFGSKEIVTATVLGKDTSRRACRYQLKLLELEPPLKRGICTSESVWKATEAGKSVFVIGRRSRVGFLVQEIISNEAKKITDS